MRIPSFVPYGQDPPTLPHTRTHTHRRPHHITLCPVWQTWAAPVNGMFSDAGKWMGKKVPEVDDVVVAESVGKTDIKVSKTCVCLGFQAD